MPDSESKTTPNSDKPDFMQLFRNLRPNSLFAVQSALTAMKHRGLTGTLVIQLNSDADRPPECYFSTAPSNLVADLWRPAA